MTALPSPRTSRPKTFADLFQISGKSGPPPVIAEILAQVRARQDELRLIQSRLGTAHERPSDMKDARDLGHTLANLVTPLLLWQDMRTTRERPR